MAAIAITRGDYDAAGLRRAAAASREADAARRMLAIVLVLEGASRADAARACGMYRQTLRDWVHRYREDGLPGLSNRQGAVGPKLRLTVVDSRLAGIEKHPALRLTPEQHRARGRMGRRRSTPATDYPTCTIVVR